MLAGMAEAGNVSTQCGTVRSERFLEDSLLELAARQHGVVTLAQVRHLGLSDSGVRSRVRRRRLHSVYRGVFAVGRPDLTGRGVWMAAALAYAPYGVLSHRD